MIFLRQLFAVYKPLAFSEILVKKASQRRKVEPRVSDAWSTAHAAISS